MKRLFLFVLLSAQTLLSQNSPYVILISFDGFRWDYPYRDVSPNITKMMDGGTSAKFLEPVFPTKTFPNHLSIITGMYTENHGIIANKFVNPKTNEIYRLGDTISTRDGKWYNGEAFWETAEKNGIKTASYFWPGSELKDSIRRPTYRHFYDHQRPKESIISGVLDWLQLPLNERPRFITAYFHHSDGTGHGFSPNSLEMNETISSLDSIIGSFQKGIEKLNLADSVNIILVSDHGMTEISEEKVINIETLLEGFEYTIQGEKPYMLIEPDNPDEIKQIFSILKLNEDHYNAYLKKDMPKKFNYSKHPFIPSIILVADLGWSLVTDRWLTSFIKWGTKGNHGYSNFELDMHGIFIASGPSFRKGLNAGSLKNIDIYPLLCRIFNISSNPKINGKLSRIEFILN